MIEQKINLARRAGRYREEQSGEEPTDRKKSGLLKSSHCCVHAPMLSHIIVSGSEKTSHVTQKFKYKIAIPGENALSVH